MTPEERARELASTLRNTSMATREAHERMILEAVQEARKDEREHVLSIIDERLEIARGLSDMESEHHGNHAWGHRKLALEELRARIDPKLCPKCDVPLRTELVSTHRCPKCNALFEENR